MTPKLLTVSAGVHQMLAEVTAEHPLLEDAGLLQFAPRGPRLDEAPATGDGVTQTAAQQRHCGAALAIPLRSRYGSTVAALCTPRFRQTLWSPHRFPFQVTRDAQTAPCLVLCCVT